jgi:hypothetical protein
MCTNCGTYKGREVVDVMKKITKREEKRAARAATKTDSQENTEK